MPRGAVQPETAETGVRHEAAASGTPTAVV